MTAPAASVPTARQAAPGDNRPALITAAQLAKDFSHVDTALKDIEAAAADVPPVFEDDDDLDMAKALAPKLRGAAKRIEELRKQTKEPFDAAGKVVQEFFKGLDRRVSDLLEKHEAAARDYLVKKQRAEAARQAEIAKAERERAAALASAAAEQAGAGRLDEAVATQAASQAAAKTADRAQAMTEARPADLARTTTASGTATLENRWGFKIVDRVKLDVWALQGYFTDAEIEAAVARFVKAGGRKLQGVEIFPDPKARL